MVATNPHSYLNKAALNVEGVTGISASGVFDPTEFSAKTTPVGADLVVIQDTEDSNAPKGVTITNLVAVIDGANTSSALSSATGVMRVNINGTTAKTEPVPADEMLIGDSEASNVNKKVSITNLTKAVGEVAAGANATSGLSEVDGVLRVNINGTTGKTAVVAADAVMVNDSEASNINKSCTLTNLQKTLGEIAAGANATSGLSEVDGVLRVNIGSTTAKTEPVVADGVMINDSEAANINKLCTITNLAKPIGQVIAGTNATSGLSEVDGVARVNINGTTSKGAPVAADAVLINDSESGNINKSATLTNVQKILGEIAAGANATSGLSEVDGVLRVNINGTTAKNPPVAADAVLINDSESGNINKSCTLTNLQTLLAGIAAGTITATGLDDATGVLTVRPLGATAKTTAVDADGILLGDSADSNKPKTLTWANMKTQLGTDMAGDGLTSAAGVLATEDPGAISVGSIRFVATGDCTSVSVGAVTYAYDATPVVADGEWAYGASASESATNLAAAINGKTDSPYTATVNSDTVHVYAEAVGTAGNVAIARTGGAQPATLENLVGGLEAANKASCVRKHTVTANDVETAVLVNIPVPFTPTMFMASVTSATGEQRILTDLFTIGATPDRIVLTGAGATHAVAGDIITVQAWE